MSSDKGFMPKLNKNKFSKKDINKIMKLNKEGKTPLEIGKIFNVDPKFIMEARLEENKKNYSCRN